MNEGKTARPNDSRENKRGGAGNDRLFRGEAEMVEEQANTGGNKKPIRVAEQSGSGGISPILLQNLAKLIDRQAIRSRIQAKYGKKPVGELFFTLWTNIVMCEELCGLIVRRILEEQGAKGL